MGASLRILLVEDNPAYRRGLRELLEAAGQLEVVGEATDGEEAVRMATSLQPDVILMDLRMPDSQGVRHEHVGLDAIREIAGMDPEVSVVVLSSTGDERLRSEARLVGARDYLLKDADKPTLIDAIRRSANGGRTPTS
ncbi:MAG: response regulator transcription factor [Actinomycetota bacterium]|nr:response regulator transcription factor [Actinomycetota bacterium]